MGEQVEEEEEEEGRRRGGEGEEGKREPQQRPSWQILGMQRGEGEEVLWQE